MPTQPEHPPEGHVIQTACGLAERLGRRRFEPALSAAGSARLLAGGRKPAPTRDGIVALLPYTAEQLPEHPQRVAVGLFQPQQHPTVGPILAIRPTTRFAHAPAELALPAPELGQQSAEWLRDPGFSAHKISALRSAGIIGAAPLPA